MKRRVRQTPSGSLIVSEPYLSTDVWRLIFLHLPVKSLLRMRSVCKLWHDMTNDPDFVSLHRTCFRNNVDKKQLLVMHKPDLKCQEKSRWTVRPLQKFTTRSKVFQGKRFPHATVMAYVDGILLLYCRSIKGGIILWNPCIKRFLQLPCSVSFKMDIIQSELKLGSTLTAGFGFDDSIKDYKVVVMSWKMGDFRISLPVVEVYEIKVGTWRPVDVSGSPCFKCWEPQALLRGVIHWSGIFTVDDFETEKLVTFDLRREIFGTIELPESGDDEDPDFQSEVSVGVVSDSLAVLVSFRDKSRFWVMDEYCDVSSWTMRYTVNIIHDSFLRILYMQPDEVIWCSWPIGVLSYDNQTGEITTLLPPAQDVRFSDVFIESLVLLGTKGTKEEDTALDSSLARLISRWDSYASLWKKLDLLLQGRPKSVNIPNRLLRTKRGWNRERYAGIMDPLK